MPESSLEERLTSLERIVAELVAKSAEKSRPVEDWRSTIGMFDDDPVMKEIIDEARKIRQADRERTKK